MGLAEMWWAYIIGGIAVGVFSSTFGVGSGIIMIPMLVLIYNLPQKSAQGVCLAVMVPIALVGAIKYKLNPAIAVDMKMVVLFSIFGVIGSYLGSYIADYASGMMLKRLFAIIMIIAAVKMLLKQ